MNLHMHIPPAALCFWAVVFAGIALSFPPFGSEMVERLVDPFLWSLAATLILMLTFGRNRPRNP